MSLRFCSCEPQQHSVSAKFSLNYSNFFSCCLPSLPVPCALFVVVAVCCCWLLLLCFVCCLLFVALLFCLSVAFHTHAAVAIAAGVPCTCPPCCHPGEPYSWSHPFAHHLLILNFPKCSNMNRIIASPVRRFEVLGVAVFLPIALPHFWEKQITHCKP